MLCVVIKESERWIFRWPLMMQRIRDQAASLYRDWWRTWRRKGIFSTVIKHTGVPIAPIPHHFRIGLMCRLSSDALTKRGECASLLLYSKLDEFMRNGCCKTHIKWSINRCDVISPLMGVSSFCPFCMGQYDVEYVCNGLKNYFASVYLSFLFLCAVGCKIKMER